MVTEADYRRAQEEESYRPKFLEQIAAAGLPRYVKSLFYEPVQKYSKQKKILGIKPLITMQTKPSAYTYFFIPGTSSTLKVFPEAFSKKSHLCLDDFLSTLEDHEYFHAQEFNESPWKNAKPFCAKVLELGNILLLHLGISSIDNYIKAITFDSEYRAYSNQLKNLSRRNCSLLFRWKISLAQQRYNLHKFTILQVIDGELKEVDLSNLREILSKRK